MSKTFQRNKSLGNDCLTVEFYIAFRPLIGTQQVDSLNYAFEYDELSNSQKQAIITFMVHSTKLLNFDWLRTVQLIPNCTPWEYLLIFHGNEAYAQS